MEPNQQLESKNNNRVWLIVVGLIMLCCCLIVIGVLALNIIAPAISNVNQQVQNQNTYTGIADEILRNGVIKALSQIESSQTGCTDLKLIDGSLLRSQEFAGDSWVETWQILACDKLQFYIVTFTPNSDGGTNFEATRVDQ